MLPRISSLFTKQKEVTPPPPHQSMFGLQVNDPGFSVSDFEESQVRTEEVKITGPSTTKKMMAALLPSAVNIGTQIGLNAFAPGLGVVVSGLIGCGTQAMLATATHHQAVSGIDNSSMWESVSRMASSFGVGAGFGSAAFAAAKSLTDSNIILEAASVSSSVISQTFFYHRDLSKTNKTMELEEIAVELARDPLQPRRSISS